MPILETALVVMTGLELFYKTCELATATSKKFAPTLQPASSVIKGLTVKGASIIGGLLQNVAKQFNLIKSDDNLDEFSYKATKSEKDMSDFDTFDDYITYLREQPLDEDSFKTRSKDDFLATQGASTVIVAKGLSEKVGMSVSPEFCTMMANNKLNPKEIVSIINTFKNSDVILNVVDYINNKLDDNLDEKIQSSELLEQALTEANPDLNENQIAEKMLNLTGNKTSLENNMPEEDLNSFDKAHEVRQEEINSSI